jgi:hypothetical protein
VPANGPSLSLPFHGVLVPLLGWVGVGF